ncbi:hypothetical protein AB0M12_29955 [Nocardia vinacea]|uniref:hypothetical protein n=1 Tax=Nocardia vinacea TaxID=96468 RepID=UPI0034494C09
MERTEGKWLGKALWGVFLLAVPVLAVVGLLIYTSGSPLQPKLSQDEKLSTQLNDLWRRGGSTMLRDLAGGDWDRVYVYHQEYLGRDEVERDIGARVEMEDTFARGRSASVLVFLKGADVQRATWVEVGLHPGIYTADVELVVTGDPSHLNFVEPPPTGTRLSEDTDLTARKSELVRTHGSALLRDLTGGDWDKVYVVTADTRAEVEAAVGSPVEMEPIFTKRGSILVFLKDGSVQRATYIEGYLPDGTYSSAVRLDESHSPLRAQLIEP